MNGCEDEAGDTVRPKTEVEGEEEDVAERVGEEAGGREAKKMQNPRMPTAAEVEEHNLTHLPFRSWCRHCVRGRGKEMPHKQMGDQPGMPELHVDLCFLGEEADPGNTITVLVARERETRMTMATVVPSKSASSFTSKRLVAFMKEVGVVHGDLLVKSDQEPAIKAILNEAGRVRATEGGGRCVMEQSPVGSSASNGIVERAILSVEQQVRVLKSAVENRWGVKLGTKHPAIPWLVEYAAVLLNRFQVSHDGKTAFERSKGKKARTLGIEFGEAVLWKRRPGGGALGKLSCLWEDGIYLGIRGSSGELVVSDLKGVWKTRTVQRKPIEDRWKEDGHEMIKQTPWAESEERPQEEAGKMEVTKMTEEEKEAEKQAEVANRFPTRFHIRKADLEKHGYSMGCPGCKAILRGTSRQGHSDACRSRFMEAMADDSRVVRSWERFDEYMAKRLEEQDAKGRKVVERSDKDEVNDAAEGSGMDVERKEPEQHEGREVEGGLGVERGQRAPEPDQGGEPKRRRAIEAKKIKDGVSSMEEEPPSERATGAEGRAVPQVGLTDMAVDEIDVAELDVNVEEAGDFERLEADEDEVEEEFDPEDLAKARAEEVEFMEGLVVWERSSWEECLSATGRPPVSTRWVDVNKGRDGRVEIRSRLVARDFKVKGDGREFEVFAAMPPLEAKRILFRMAALAGSVKGDPQKGAVKLMFIDIKKAHLNGKLREDEFAYVQLPEEAGGGVGRLRRWLYGMRPAASAWEEEYSDTVVTAGFMRGKSAPTVFWNPRSDARLVVWGDDFTVLGRDGDLREFRDELSKKYSVKVRAVLGPEPGDDKETRILNRKLTWGDSGLIYEGDEQHVKTIIAGMGLQEESKGLSQAVYKEDDGEDESEELEPWAARRYRSLAAVVNYLSLDRPDLQFAASVLGRSMARPTERAQLRLKKVARYLLAHRVVEHVYSFGTADDARELVAWSDSDWAGDWVHRRSTTGGLLELAGGVVKSWSNRQGSVALSSGEAEFYAAGKAAIEAIGGQSLLKDLGWDVQLRVCLDASAAQSIASRQGLGKMRHVDVRYLWLQEVVRAGRLQLQKVRGAENPADVLTKPLTSTMALDLLRRVGVRLRGVSSQEGVCGKGACRGTCTP